MNTAKSKGEEKERTDGKRHLVKNFCYWILVLWTDFKKRMHKAQFVVEVGVFIVVVAYTTVAFLQWNIARQALRLDQRPWLTPRERGPLQLQIGQRIAQDLYFQNIGKTAALDIKVEAVMKIVKDGGELSFDYSRPAILTTPVLWQNEPTLPEALFINESPTEATMLTQGLAQQYANRQIEIVRYGRMTYSDIWGLGHKTTFCKSDRAPDPSGIIYMTAVGTKCTAYTSVDTNY